MADIPPTPSASKPVSTDSSSLEEQITPQKTKSRLDSEETPLHIVHEKRAAAAVTVKPLTKLVDVSSFPEGLSGDLLKERVTSLFFRLASCRADDATCVATVVFYLGRISEVNRYLVLHREDAWPALRKNLLLRLVDPNFYDKVNNVYLMGQLKPDHGLLSYWERLQAFNIEREMELSDESLWKIFLRALSSESHYLSAFTALSVMPYTDKMEHTLQILDAARQSHNPPPKAVAVNVIDTPAVMAATAAAPRNDAAAAPAPIINVYIDNKPRGKPVTTKKNATSSGSGVTTKKPVDKGEGCWNCGEMGHYRRNCSKPKNEQAASTRVDR